ncbi:MAG: arginase family protein [Candidatus Helarchaeales archaeon]
MKLFSFSDVELNNNTRFVMIGIPLCATSTIPTEANLGPKAIREASLRFGDQTELGFDLNGSNLLDLGDIQDLKDSKDAIEYNLHEIESYLQENFLDSSRTLITLGGDHFVTYPVIKFLSSKHESFGIISFDAHLDFYDIWAQNESFSHCTVMRRISDFFNVDEHHPILFVGIRDHDAEEYIGLMARQIPFIRAREFYQGDPISRIKEITSKWKEIDISNVYLSIDIDVLDPGIAPGTGYKIPGGISFWDLWHCLKEISETFNIIGFDVVEVDPSSDVSGLTSSHAAKIIMELISFIQIFRR